jgi:hypothetical protein
MVADGGATTTTASWKVVRPRRAAVTVVSVEVPSDMLDWFVELNRPALMCRDSCSAHAGCHYSRFALRKSEARAASGIDVSDKECRRAD